MNSSWNWKRRAVCFCGNNLKLRKRSSPKASPVGGNGRKKADANVRLAFSKLGKVLFIAAVVIFLFLAKSQAHGAQFAIVGFFISARRRFADRAVLQRRRLAVFHDFCV